MGNCLSNNELAGIDPSKVKKFSHKGKTYMAKIAPKDCYDGDTCWICIKFNGELTKIKCRLVDIDCSEMRQKKVPLRKNCTRNNKRLKLEMNYDD